MGLKQELLYFLKAILLIFVYFAFFSCRLDLEVRQPDHPKKHGKNKVPSVNIKSKLNNTIALNSCKKDKTIHRTRIKMLRTTNPMSAIPEQHFADSSSNFKNKNMNLYHSCKLNETPKSSVSTDTEVYCINFHNINSPYHSFDDSTTSDNDGYNSERHVRVIRQVSSDTYCSDNCFYSDSETTKYPDIVHHDNTTSNILYEMCVSLNKVPDILTGNIDTKETPSRYSGTSSSSYHSDDRSPNWSPNSNLQFKQWDQSNIDNETIANDMTDTDSIIYHSVEDSPRAADNVSKRSLNFLNSTVDLFNTKPNAFKVNPIVHDKIKVDEFNQVLQYPEDLMSSGRSSESSHVDQTPKKSSKEFINLDVLNKLNLNQIDHDVDQEISTLLGTECLLKRKKLSESEPHEKASNFYEHNSRYLNSYYPSNPVDLNKKKQSGQEEITYGQQSLINNNFSDFYFDKPHTFNKEDYNLHSKHENFFEKTDNLNESTNKENEHTQINKRRKRCNENFESSSMDSPREKYKQYDLSESLSAPNIFDRNKKYRYSTSSIEEGSDYDPEITFYKFSKSISNVNLHEYGKKYLGSSPSRNRNSKEELRRIEKAVEKMLEQVELQENLLENDINNMPISLKEKKVLPLLYNVHASASKISDSMIDVPINCNRNPLKYKYQTKHDLNVASSSNVSSSCSIEDLERSVNKLLSDVEQEESKLFSSEELDRYNAHSVNETSSGRVHKISEKYIPFKSVALDSKMFSKEKSNNSQNQSRLFGHKTQYSSHPHDRSIHLVSNYSCSSSLNDSSDHHIPNNLRNDQEVWWEGAYQFGLPEDEGGYRKKIKRSNKRAAFWPNNPYGLDRQISYTPSSEEGFSSSSNSESDGDEVVQAIKKAAVNIRVKPLNNGKCGIDIETKDISKDNTQFSNHSLNSLWNRSLPSLPSASSESSFPSALSIRSSGSEDCLSNLNYYQNLVIPATSIEYITPAELGFTDSLSNSGYCHWNFHGDEGKQ